MSDLEVMERRQKVLADFGDMALQSEDLDTVLTEVCRLVVEALGSGRAKVMEIEPEGESLLVRAGVGWGPDVVGHVRIAMSENSSESFTIKLGEPLMLRDIRKEDRFSLPDFLKKAGIVALANVPIFLPGRRAYGVLQVDDTVPRDFDRNDTEFLRTYASLLGPVIDRLFKLQKLRRIERHHDFLLALSDALRAEPSAEAVAGRALRMLSDEMQLDRCYVGTYSLADDRTDIPHQVGNERVPPLPSSVRHSDFPDTLRIVPEGTLVINDVMTAEGLSSTDRTSIGSFGLRALVAATLHKGEHSLLWSMAAVSAEPRHWTQGEVALLQEVAERTWAAMERAGADAALRLREERFRALTSTTNQVIYRMSPDWSEMFELRGSGILPDTGEPFAAWADIYLLAEDRSMILDAIAAAIRSRSLFELEHRVRRADGSVGWVLSRAVPISGPDGEIVEWFGASTDTTVRREAEERLRTAEERHLANLESLVQERTAELRASRDLLRAIIDSSVDMIQVFEAVRDETGQIVDFRWVLNNHTSESRFGKVHGQSLLERNPGVLVEGIFDDFKRVTEKGEPVLKERYYAHEQFNGWFFQSVVKLDDGVATTTKDITDWKAAQEEVLRLRDEVAQVQVRETEERLAAIFVNAAVGLSELALNGRFLEVNDELCRILGRPREEVLRLSVPEVTHPEDVQATLEAVAAAQAGAGLVSLDKRYQRPDGTVVWANSRVSVLRHGEGQPDTLLAVTIDLTERRAAEEALRESEARFRQFGDASGDVLWIRDAETLEFEYISPAVEEVYGIRPEDLLGGNHMLRWLGLVIPEDRDLALDHTRRVRGGEHALNAFRILHRGDGSVRWIRDHSFPLLDAEGRVQRIGGMGHDATEEVELHGRLHVLVAELQHRTRNLMSVVRSVTDKTLSNSTSLDDFQGRIRDRLDALARVNSLLSRLDGGSRITFDELIRTELIAHGVTDAEEPMSQVSLEGPEGVRLRSSSVQTLALGLHELATNALKYGALSRPEGHLSVRWELLDSPEGEPRLRVDWRESGVPVLTLVPDSATGGEPTAPRRRGYGRELIEKALPYQLKAETSYELTPQGLRCRITLPVSSTMGRADGTAKEEPDD